ncbi:MAG: FAD-dependent oxidoreductase [Planctomycetota bacterium]|nr:FAD-dependent oxidoreductase [Planctomycetota bacterium]
MAAHYQVIVIGGGHAGVEAAWACANIFAASGVGGTGPRPADTGPERPRPEREAREPRPVALVTLDPGTVGVMSCNPAIGGLAKGQLVREIDAMGGLMGLATDLTGIQFKVLNQSKGPAVHGPRAQCDKHAYAECVRALIASRPEIDVVGGSVERLLVRDGKIEGVEVRRSDGSHETLLARAVVLTTGTFMRGLMHCGEQRTPGGRFGEGAAVGISGALRELGFELGRLKTGTPPRLRRGSIEWDALEPALGDESPVPFSDLTGEGIIGWASGQGEPVPQRAGEPHYDEHGPASSLDRFPVLSQVECRQTRTTPEAHALIRANLHRAPMYSGQIESAGPRYCPSIEDKVVRFAERDSHGVFLEPESLRDDWVYCNGVSTSLPPDVQDVVIRSMPGCAAAEILRYGYAVEYDMVRPHQIHATGMTRLVEGLFLAGQINGTSGYEEAAAQGLVAGINAARFVLGAGEVVIGRDAGYIGVLMDDLVTKTPVEPYRMFTSRAEHRLCLRSDNAPDRLTPLAIEMGLLGGTALGRARAGLFERRGAIMRGLHAAIERTGKGERGLAHRCRSDVFEAGDLRRELDALGALPAGLPARVLDGAIRTVHADRRYEAYVVRQRADVRRRADMEERRLPEGVDYRVLTHLRAEAREALHRFRPRTYGQAGRLEGVTPADLTLLAVLLEKARRGEGRATG